MNDARRPLHSLRSGATALLMLFVASSALAQSEKAPAPGLTPEPPQLDRETPESGVPPLPHPDYDRPPSVDESEAEAKPRFEPDEDLDPAEALDRAFAELKSEDEEAQARAGQKIVKLWARSGSPSMDLLLKRGQEAIAREDADAAIEHLTDLVTLAPDFAEGWHARAQAHALKEDFSAALFDLAETVALEQRHFLAFAELGALLEDLGREQEAMVAFRKSLDIFPGFQAAKNAVERLAPSVDGRDA